MFIQNPVEFKMLCRHTGAGWKSCAWAIYQWLQDSGHMDRWVSCDGTHVAGIIRADRFAEVLPRLQRLARGPVEFWTVAR